MLSSSGENIVILMATYNGGEYIDTQIQSILAQTYTNWSLFIRDDNSTDNTRDIIHGFCEKDVRISLVDNNSEKGGACHNFSQLLKIEEAKKASYIMFCDQDDYWSENKIEKMFATMIEKEQTNQGPILIYSDFIFADQDLNILENETIDITAKWKEPSLSGLLVINNIYGCTMMINNALITEVNPVPEFAENHDYWVALVSSAVGEIYHIKEPLMKYRQHSNNVSGSYLNNTLKFRLKRLFFEVAHMRESITKIQSMTIELYSRHRDELNANDKLMLSEYINKIVQNKRFGLVFYIIRKGISRNGFLQNCLLYTLLLTAKKATNSTFVIRTIT